VGGFHILSEPQAVGFQILSEPPQAVKSKEPYELK
jgi:hypothetical protein